MSKRMVNKWNNGTFRGSGPSIGDTVPLNGNNDSEVLTRQCLSGSNSTIDANYGEYDD